MAKNKNNRSNARTSKPAATKASATAVGATVPSPGALWMLGLLCLIVSAGAALMLVLQNLAGMAIPGCGEGSPCASLARSVWGKVPGIGYPVSSLGLAYFIAVLGGWALARRGTSNLFRWIVRAGVFASLLLLTVIVIKGEFCPYCITVHVGNIAFWLLMEWSSRSGAVSARPSAAVVGVFIVASGVLAGVEWQQREKIARKEEAELVDSTTKIIQGSGGTDSTTTNVTSSTATAPATAPTGVANASTAASQPQGFTGRYRSGPEDAPIRIVIFSDYQCNDCRNLEMQAKLLLGSRTDVSLSPKQFPLDIRCNPVLTSTMHDNACKAAKVAEAAGLLRGSEGFWQMHHWLFERGGDFSDPDLQRKLQEWGYDSAEFDQAMNSAEVAQRLRNDALEAQSLGILFTPMVFINGVELRGYRAERALIKAVDQISAANPKPALPLNDKPAQAATKYIGDWKFNPKQPMPEAVHAFPPGAPAASGAAVRVDVFGDLQDANTSELNAIVRGLVSKTPNAVYVFHAFPFDLSCNSTVSRTVNALACRAVRAAEAAAILGGDEAYWKMHQWLLTNREQFNDDTLREAAVAQGLDPQKFFETMESSAVSAAIAKEVAAAKSLAVSQLPSIYVNGRFLPRWKLDNVNVIERVIEAAAK